MTPSEEHQRGAGDGPPGGRAQRRPQGQSGGAGGRRASRGAGSRADLTRHRAPAVPPPGELDPLEIPGGDELFADLIPGDTKPLAAGPDGAKPVGGDASDDPAEGKVDVDTPDTDTIDAKVATDTDTHTDTDSVAPDPVHADAGEVVTGRGGKGKRGAARAAAADPPAEVAEPDIELILPDTAALTKERDDYLRALQLLQADFENYRKRVQRQQDEQAARATRDLVGKILPVLDNLDLAETHLGGAEEPSPEAKAMSQARLQLLEVLGKEGLERVDTPEVEFDPEDHDAVAYSAESEGSNGSSDHGRSMVEEVLRSGYRWRGQTLRPAMVRVRG